MQATNFNFLQVVPPIAVFLILGVASYFFYTRYVAASRGLVKTINRVSNALRSMTEGDEAIRKEGVTRVFKETILEKSWYDFSRTLHVQRIPKDSSGNILKHRITVPASYFFSVSNIVDQTLSVDYFKHLPGILTGVGIIGTFSGLLFGLSNFDSSSPDLMVKSVGVLLSGVREAFYASSAAIAAAMIITHTEKILYQRCLTELERLVDSINTLFEAGVGEEYLSILVNHTKSDAGQHTDIRHEVAQTMAAFIKQLDAAQSNLANGFADSIDHAIANACRQLGNQIDSSLLRQVKTPIEELSNQISQNLTQNTTDPQLLARKVIRARLNETTSNSPNEVL